MDSPLEQSFSGEVTSNITLVPPSKEERERYEKLPSNTILTLKMTPDFYAHMNKLLAHEEKNRDRALVRAREKKEKVKKNPTTRQRKEVHYNYEIVK